MNINITPITKTVDINLVPLQIITVTNTSLNPIFGPFDVSNIQTLKLFTHVGRIDTGMNAILQFTNINIEASSKSSGDNSWYIINLISGFGISAGSQSSYVNITGSAPSGQSIIPITNTLSFYVGQFIFIVNPIFGNSEFHQIRSIVPNTSITITGNLSNDQSTSTIYLTNNSPNPEAIRIITTLDCTSIKRIRFVFNGTSYGPGTANCGFSIDATTQNLPSISCSQ